MTDLDEVVIWCWNRRNCVSLTHWSCQSYCSRPWYCNSSSVSFSSCTFLIFITVEKLCCVRFFVFGKLYDILITQLVWACMRWGLQVRLRWGASWSGLNGLGLEFVLHRRLDVLSDFDGIPLCTWAHIHTFSFSPSYCLLFPIEHLWFLKVSLNNAFVSTIIQMTACFMRKETRWQIHWEL